MKEIIKEVLDKYKNLQLNLNSDSARESLAEEIQKAISDFNLTIIDDEEKHTFPGLDVILKETNKLSEQISDTRPDGDGTEWIYESPDGGKTIYKRAVGSDEKILVKDINDER